MSNASSLISQKKKKSTQKQGYERDVREVEEKIRRLKAAKTRVSDIKMGVSDLARRTKSSFDDLGDWQGTQYRWAKTEATENLHSRYVKYRNDTDYVLDRICDEITRLQNENTKLLGLIGSLARAINNLANEIEKLFN